MVKLGKAIAFLCLGWLISLPGQAQSGDLDKVIAQLNAAAAKFTSAQADFTWDIFTAVAEDHELQTGTIYFERKKGNTRMAAQLKLDDGKLAPKTILYDHGDLQLYEPTIKQLTLVKAGANQSQFESFLTLGFGGSGTDLENNWKVSLLGAEQMGGVSVAKLDLVPKEQKVLDMFSHVTIWVDPARGVSYKQIYYQPKDAGSRTATYQNIRYNVPLPAEVFQIKPAPGTHTVQR